MRLVNDTLKERGKWSMGRLSILAILAFNISVSGYLTYTTKAISDIPVNWLGLIVTIWGINKASTTTTDIKGIKNVDSPTVSEQV